MLDGMKWLKRLMGSMPPPRSAAPPSRPNAAPSTPPGDRSAEVTLTRAQLRSVELYVDHLRGELDTQRRAIEHAVVDSDALRAELRLASEERDALRVRIAQAAARVRDAELRLELEAERSERVLSNAQHDTRERLDAGALQVRSLEHKLQHAESTVESLGLERQSLLSRIALLEQRCGGLTDELGGVKSASARRDSELARVRGEVAWRSGADDDATRSERLRGTLRDLVALSAHALDVLAGSASHLALELACRDQRRALARRLGEAHTREDALARTREHLLGTGLLVALEPMGRADERELQLALVSAVDAEPATGRWLAAYAVACINACGATDYRVEHVEGGPEQLVVAASLRSFDSPGAALRSA
jgi:hypothetical protein